jgi:hypothetical protein
MSTATHTGPSVSNRAAHDPTDELIGHYAMDVAGTVPADGIVDTDSLHDERSLLGTRLRVIGPLTAVVSIETPGQ